MTTVECYSFNYNKLDGGCDLYMYGATGNGGGPVVGLETDDNGYDYYELRTEWVSPTAGLLNLPGALVYKAPHVANVTLTVNVTNRGTLMVPSGTLTLSGGGRFSASAALSLGSSGVLEIKGSSGKGSYDVSSGFDATAAAGERLI
jgi:hypothetical protein